MTAEARQSAALLDLGASYGEAASGYDEMWVPLEKAPHAHWQILMQDLSRLRGGELERRRLESSRLLRENGVTYNVYNDPRGQQRTWQLDPIPLMISSADWAVISAGLKQRARLLDYILRDLYGPRHLIRDGLLPPELVFSHQGFLRPCDQTLDSEQQQLLLYAADLARGPDGRMWVIGDRTQAPSGAGYALETRSAMTRVMAAEFRHNQVHRLSLFFRNLRAMLSGLMADKKDDPHVVLLTPGPRNETYFEHAYLASYLGYTLVQGDDLSVRDGKVWMKSIDGLKQVDIIVRRVDDTFCDPLELREDSLLGVPGLLEAARQGNVVIANPLGSSLLESPALNPFLPNIAQKILGEEILLPSAATWWCGDKTARDHVLKNLADLVIKPIDRRLPSIFASSLDKAGLETLKTQILSAPYLYVGQQVLSCSTAPSLRDEKIVPRRALLRTFLTAHQGDYDVMPGGLTRTAPDEHSVFITNQTGGLSKDTWVLADKPDDQTSLWPSPQARVGAAVHEVALTSRSGENLYWVGRYAARAEAILRVLRSVIYKLSDYDDYRDDSDLQVLERLLVALTFQTGMFPGFVGDEAKEKMRNPRAEIMRMATDPNHPGSLIGTLNLLMQSAFNVRDIWSVDTWRVIDDIDEILQSIADGEPSFVTLQNNLDSLLGCLMAFFGQTQESMPHESGWYLFNIGRRMERALQLSGLVRHTVLFRSSEVVEHLILEALLVNQESLSSHRRRYRAAQSPSTVFDLMLLDVRHPRSLAYQVRKISELVERLPQSQPVERSHSLNDEQRIILKLYTEFQLADLNRLVKVNDESGVRTVLDGLLTNVEKRVRKASEFLTQRYFSHTSDAYQLAPTRTELL
ncbi:MAG: circularly permuted type 2 ATP-grasp protein [Alcanivoracaceae bacterium]|nr:circularly permuted type 2 ATP-grasp protein [Alcanivoracaceae bacterium]